MNKCVKGDLPHIVLMLLLLSMSSTYGGSVSSTLVGLYLMIFWSSVFFADTTASELFADMNNMAIS